jgi:hypothetical protein
MKRFHYMICALLFGACAYVGYSDSHEIKKDSFQVTDQEYSAVAHINSIDMSAELNVALVVDAPYLGRPASQLVMVSEELADGFVIRIRPPPEKVQKSEFKNLI